MGDWKYYFPDEGEDEGDARAFKNGTKFFDAEDAAVRACELDFSNHDGWERGNTEFRIAIVGPDGKVSVFRACHEPSVEHRVYEDA